jgi:hypothetical protein
MFFVADRKSNPNIEGTTRYLHCPQPKNRLERNDCDGMVTAYALLSRHSNFIRMAIKRSSRVRFSLCPSLGKIWFKAMKTASTPPSTIWSSTFGARTLGKWLVRYSEVVGNYWPPVARQSAQVANLAQLVVLR